MNRAFLGMSHSPLIGLNEIPPAAEQALNDAFSRTRKLVQDYDPELIVLIAPDHYNGFFNQLMPPFCIGTQARSVGDYLSSAGPLNVDGAVGLDLADALMDDGFDMTVSRRMTVDHGFAQPLELLWGGLDTPPVVPIFLNAVAPPSIPRLQRCRSLGIAIGRFLDGIPQRTLVIGSGGLSHEPPVPNLNHPDPVVRERITVPCDSIPIDLEAKKQRVMAAGRAMARGDNSIKPLNPEWDRRWMEAIAGSDADLNALCRQSEESIDLAAGHSAHESKSWLIARSALSPDVEHPCVFQHYQTIPEYIAGFGLMFMH